MQAWDQVAVESGEFKGQAGLVIRVNTAQSIATVKLDTKDEPVEFAFAELKLLGR